MVFERIQADTYLISGFIMLKIRLIVTTSLTIIDFYNVVAWLVVLGITVLFWFNLVNLLF